MAKTLEPGDPVIVTWRDAYNLPETWTTKIDKKEDFICRSIGYFTHQNKRFFTIVGDSADQGLTGRILRVPIGMVIKVKRL